jgi:hypothetical protein
MNAAVEVRARERLSILSVAALFTSQPADSVAVAINAGPLLAWAEAAAGESDLQVRIRILRQHSVNYVSRNRTDPDPALDSPDEFLRAAGVLYAFATAGDPS